jgi:catechol 2,3-dioxygenase-like lactoylglutathione lyase family enzyme
VADAVTFRLELVTVPVADVDRAKRFYVGRRSGRREKE